MTSRKAGLGIAAMLLLSGAGANAATAGKRIALSNNYAGNSWRQTMLTSWTDATGQAVKLGVVKEAPAFTTAENQVTEQAAQIQNMILQGYDAIVIDAASPNALNGAIKSACDAGITVVSFDGIATAPCAWRLTVDFKGMGAEQVDYLAQRLPQGGNLIQIRGIAGTSIDDAFNVGMLDALKRHPNFHLVSTVYGNWTQTVAQKAVAGVLPGLPTIAGVLTEGGDGYGAAQAFSSAGRQEPIIIMGNRQDELAWWKQEHDKDGYTTMSSSIAPGVVTLAFWVAQQVLDGKPPPKDLQVPYLRISQDTLADTLAKTPSGGLANKLYTQQDAEQLRAVGH
nr:ABC transporter substrate-binding protein [uncultured Lichenicoccus sp.]